MTEAAIGFGTLVDVGAREAWPLEAQDFTPWLADNLERLAESIGVRMELTERESGVGRFSADIVARTTLEDDVVLIENQLERSDHTHLGQIMTYLAGTNAKIVIWVAPSFCEEHLSAIQWLNQHSHEEFSFFAVKLRVVRIGDSPLAPLFEVLEKPNSWDRSVQQEVRSNAEPSQTALTRRAFWERYVQLYPEMANCKSGGGGSSRWLELADRGVVISRYKAKNDVGIFLRGGAGVDQVVFDERIRPFEEQLQRLVSLEPGRFHDFSKRGPSLTDDPETWDAAIHWLEEQSFLYRQAIEAVIPQDPE